jgi:hypothetical protein
MIAQPGPRGPSDEQRTPRGPGSATIDHHLQAFAAERQGVGQTMERSERVKRNTIESQAILQAFAADLEWVSQVVVGDLRPKIEAKIPRTRKLDACLGQFRRIDAWLRTLCKLSEPMHFQATAAGARSMLELAVDLVLLASDQNAAERLYDWEWSAKYKHATAVKRFYETVDDPVPPENAEAVTFAVREEAKIESLRRKQGWLDGKNKPYHPPRWTKRNLDADCVEADKWPHRGAFSFVRFYETRFRTLCWQVHGSAFVGRTIGADVFPFLSAQALLDASDLAVIGASATLHVFDLWTRDVKAAFEKFASERHRRRNDLFLKARAAQQAVAADDPAAGKSE